MSSNGLEAGCVDAPGVVLRRLGREQLIRVAMGAVFLVSIGVGVPLVMMLNGALRLEIDYYTWTWWTIPAIWAPSVLAAAALPRWPGPASFALFLGSLAGLTVFWMEFGWLSFGPVALGSAAIYVTHMHRELHGGQAGPAEIAASTH